VEHYEIASYGTLRTWADLLGRKDVVSLLEDTLEEEKETDRRLTEIAESFVNLAAASGEGEEEEKQESARGARGRTAGRRATTARAARPVAAERPRSGSARPSPRGRR
jgi:Domain of unknown function (DUF892)